MKKYSQDTVQKLVSAKSEISDEHQHTRIGRVNYVNNKGVTTLTCNTFSRRGREYAPLPV